jgi:FlaA1/EpsC-like NDP-sugar epimerase
VKDIENPEGDIEIAVTGLRPGEKLYEELLIGDNPGPTAHPRIMKAHEECLPWGQLKPKIVALESALNENDIGLMRKSIQELVAGYTPSEEIVDWVYLARGTEANTIYPQVSALKS